MRTIDKIEEILRRRGIEYSGAIRFEKCKIINQSLLERRNVTDAKTAIMLLAPYYSGRHEERNVSLYAVPMDYHLFFKDLFEKVVPELTELFPGYWFYGFADSSPISEVSAAALAGLGVIGKNHLLINPKYGSYVFIGEILTNLELEYYREGMVSFCISCGKCTSACPSKTDCLSALTQKKGEKSASTCELIRKTGIAWGCDICQEVCPLNSEAEETPLDFFKKGLTERISAIEIEQMESSDFEKRAYAWKGKKTIISNLNELNEKK